MINLALSGVLAVGIGSGHALLLRCLTMWFLRSRAMLILLVATVVFRLVLVSMITAILFLGGPGPAMSALAGCWIGRTMALTLR
jgi:hypothetical protein